MIAPTDFFKQQRIQRQRTYLLVLLFIFTVGAISALTGLCVPYVIATATDVPLSQVEHYALPAAMVTSGFIALVSVLKVFFLLNGGEAIAQLLGAKRVSDSNADELRRRLLDVVEEMSIASGTPLPKVYVLEGEPSVNAMAAGFTLSDSVIIVTEGALEALTRDELQGVVAHEFSHILNGDMAMNIRLTGAIAGLVIFWEIGRLMMEETEDENGRRGRPLFLFGLALFVFGGLGVLSARIMQAAISRGRETLADASSAQFTRNPSGLASALAKVRFFLSSQIYNPRSDQTSHFFFADALGGSGLSSLFSTHPPLEERIQRLDPSFLSAQRVKELGESLKKRDFLVDKDPARGGLRVEPSLDRLSAYANQVLAEIPVPVRQALRTGAGAKAGLLAVALTGHAEKLSSIQQAILREDAVAADVLSKVFKFAQTLSEDRRINIVFLSMNALNDLGRREKAELLRLLEEILSTSVHERVFDFAILVMVRNLLLPGQLNEEGRKSLVTIRPVAEDVGRLFLWLCSLGHLTPEQTRSVYATAMSRVTPRAQPWAPSQKVSLDEVSQILLRLKGVQPIWKERVVKGMWDCITGDGAVQAEEAEAARAIAAALGVPIPPVVAVGAV